MLRALNCESAAICRREPRRQVREATQGRARLRRRTFVNFPGGNPEQMYYSLTQKLMALPDDMILFPGHNYAPLKHATMGEQKKTNPYLKCSSLKQFLAAMGYR